jgi:hypothetical protein
MATYQYRPLNKELKEIRVLYFEVDSHTSPDAPIRCRLETVSLRVWTRTVRNISPSRIHGARRIHRARNQSIRRLSLKASRTKYLRPPKLLSVVCIRGPSPSQNPTSMSQSGLTQYVSTRSMISQRRATRWP